MRNDGEEVGATGYPMAWWDPVARGRIGVGMVLADPAWRTLELSPPPDPARTREELKALLAMQADSAERERRKSEIAAQRGDIITPFVNVLVRGSELPDERPPRLPPRTVEICEAMKELGRYVIVHYKSRFNRARPYQLEPALRPMLSDPGHPAYPSGHSLQVHLIALMLAEVMPRAKERLLEVAMDIAVNREWAGVHYRSDTEAGKRLAEAMLPLMRRPFYDPLEGARAEWAAYVPLVATRAAASSRARGTRRSPPRP
jgi:hypothetical protein